MDLIKLTDIALESSSISEMLYDEYDSAVIYATDDIVYVSYASDRITVIEDCESPWNEYVDVDVTATLDTGDYQGGSGAAKFVVVGGCGAGDILATSSIVSKDMSKGLFLRLWIKSSVALAAGDLRILLDNTAKCVSALKELDIPTLVVDEWTEVDLDLGDAANLTSIISIGIEMVVDKDVFDLRIDDVQMFVAENTPHEIYKSLADANEDNYPPDYPAKWSLLGATNKWKMFDAFVNTQTEDSDPIIVELDPCGADCVGLFRLEGTKVTLTLSSLEYTQDYYGDASDYYKDETGGKYEDDEYSSAYSVKKTEIVSLDDSAVDDYWGYFFADFSYNKTLFWTFPVYYSNAILRIEITPYVDSAKCGMCALGKSITLGKTHYNPSISMDDYSKKATDDLGRTYLSQGNYARINEFDMWLENADVDMVRRAFEDVRGIPIMTNANGSDTNYESLIIYGYYNNFDIIIPGPNISKCSVEIKGLT